MSRNASKKCADCGIPIIGMAQRCPDCHSKHRLEQNQAYYERNREKCLAANKKYKASRRENPLRSLDPWLGRNYVIVEDPIPVEDGGYRPGAQFSMTDLTWMAKFGALSDGVLIKDSVKNDYLVVDQGNLVRR